MATKKPAAKKKPVSKVSPQLTAAFKSARYASHLNEAYARDVARRNSAVNILSPNEIGGEYDAARQLYTTLGGVPRAITTDDLRAFQQSVKKLGKTFKGGITAKSVVSLSLPIDRQRASEQIKTALPMRSRAGVMHFVTNASEGSPARRHNVVVELLDFTAVTATPIANLTTAAKLLRQGGLKFDCDCGRHTFWYRYVATIGGFNAGRAETGFPKIRNPKLVGVACKHVLRVMQKLQTDSSVLGFIGKMIDKARTAEIGSAPKVITQTAAEIKAALEVQARNAGRKYNEISATKPKMSAKAVKVVKAVIAKEVAVMEAIKPTKAQLRKTIKAFETIISLPGNNTNKRLLKQLAKARADLES